METTTSTFDLVMDLLGTFPESKERSMYVLVIADHFSKFLVLHAIKRAKGKELAAIWRQLSLSTWGSCRRLVSDNVPQMVSRHVAEICIIWGVKRVFTLPYHLQSNWVERVLRNLRSIWCCFVGSGREWDKHIPEFMTALNSFRHDITWVFHLQSCFLVVS